MLSPATAIRKLIELYHCITLNHVTSCLVRFVQKDRLYEGGNVLHGFNNFHNLGNAGLLESMKDVNLPYEI